MEAHFCQKHPSPLPETWLAGWLDGQHTAAILFTEGHWQCLYLLLQTQLCRSSR